MQTYRRTTWIALVVLGAFLMANYSIAQPSFRRASERQAERRPASEYLRLPSAGTLRALALDFETVAADAAWILSLVHYGPRSAEDPEPKHLLKNARTIADLDPRFYDVYEWVSGTFVALRGELRFEDIEELNTFLKRGMDSFPQEYWLPYDIGMNYVGYPRYASPEQKLEGYRRATEFAKRASTLEGAPTHLPFAVKWLHEKRRALRAKLEGEESSSASAPNRDYFDFLARVYYLAEDESLRREIEAELEQTPAGRKALAKLEATYTERLKRNHARSFAYLPVDHWTIVAAQMDERR